MTAPLFDLEPAPTPVKLSADARRTQRRNATIAAGRNPATRLPLLNADTRQTCGTCAHSVDFKPNLRTYWKCEKAGITHGAGTDIRLSWPACTAWTDRARLVPCPACAGKGRLVNPDRDPKSPTYLRCDTCRSRGEIIEVPGG